MNGVINARYSSEGQRKEGLCKKPVFSGTPTPQRELIAWMARLLIGQRNKNS